MHIASFALSAALALTGTSFGQASPSAGGGSNAGNTCAHLLAGAAQDESAPKQGRPASPKKIKFAGYEWRLKSSGDKRVGPGPCYFSDSDENVSIDSRGRLRLHITQREERWYCPELISEESFGFGTYRFYLSSPLEKLDANVILGLFTWSDSREFAHREIDIECAKWGKAQDTNNAQFVVQPYQLPGRLVRFRVPPHLEALTLGFTWESNRIYFECLAGHAVTPTPTNPMIREWTFTGSGIPQPGDENVRINLWLLGGRAPKDVTKTEAILSGFEFVPLPDRTSRGVPAIVITDRPHVRLKPGPVGMGPIGGTVSGIEATNCKVVVYAYGDRWYVQPLAAAPYTKVMENGTWKTWTHGGLEYAALLVKPTYKAPPSLPALPEVGGEVLAVAKVAPRE